MFLQKNIKRVGSKIYRSALIVESYREGKKVKHRTIVNVSNLPSSTIDAIELSLKGNNSPNSIEDLQRKTGKSFGGLWAIKTISDRLMISKALGSSKKAMLVMIMICGRILTQGSRRHLKFWQDGQAITEIFKMNRFDEDDLYEALDWLESNQGKIEEKLFRLRNKEQDVRLFLYDITSSYLEGQHNELAEFGYNRDGKRGKKQIVIGLLTDKDGVPVAVEVFKGNTTDCTTVAGQVQKLANRFGVKDVVFVGDRGMVKKTGIDSLHDRNWHYVTAITKPQIESLIHKGALQLSLFEENLMEVEDKGVRYILRRNPIREAEVRTNRQDRIRKIELCCEELNEKLVKKPRSKEATALKHLREKISQYKLGKVFTASVKDRTLTLIKDEEEYEKLARLDGCYVIKTDLAKEDLGTDEVHSVYKNLSFVEQGFRTMKTGLLEIRPLFHRKANRTRACAMIAMFAYMITQYIFKVCKELELPLEPLIEKLDQIQTQQFNIADQWMTLLPTELRNDQQAILDSLSIKLPKSLPNGSKSVARKS